MAKYQILQLDANHVNYLFRRYRNDVKKSWYNVVYSGEIEPNNSVMATLEGLYFIFNMKL